MLLLLLLCVYLIDRAVSIDARSVYDWDRGVRVWRSTAAVYSSSNITYVDRAHFRVPAYRAININRVLHSSNVISKEQFLAGQILCRVYCFLCVHVYCFLCVHVCTNERSQSDILYFD